MRQNVIIALLSVIATLLLASVLSQPQPMRGQNAGGTASVGAEAAVATGPVQGGTGAAFWLYIPQKEKLAVYFLGNNGLELRSVRDLKFDLEVNEINRKPGEMTP